MIFVRINEYFLSSYSKIEKVVGFLLEVFIHLRILKIIYECKCLISFIQLYFHFTFFIEFSPKLAITKQIYFIITRGKIVLYPNQEILGRLSFCGYELINEINLGDQLYFICKKKRLFQMKNHHHMGQL